MTDNGSESVSVVDLFCGAGGFSLGLSEAGFRTVWAIDSDANATETFAANHDASPVTGDIRETDTDAITDGGDGAIDIDEIDLVVGGPPCPTHSHVGRNRLEGPMTVDERHSLYEEFIRFVDELRPTALLMENVPGMTHSETEGGLPVIKDIMSRCEELGYRVSLEKIDAADYGVPQHRERLFIVGNAIDSPNPHLSAWETHREPHGEDEQSAKIIDTDIGGQISAETTGTGGTQQMTLGVSDEGTSMAGVDSSDDTFTLPQREASLRPWNTVADALTDLPSATSDGESVKYEIEALTPFQRWVRTANGTGVDSHGERTISKRDRALYVLLGSGVGYSIDQLPDSLCPHNTDSFPDKYRKLNPNRPSQTVIAHISKGGHRFVHPRVPRPITVREAARLQSFPDEFTFPVARTNAYRQVGNAVPPLVAYALGTALRETIFG